MTASSRILVIRLGSMGDVIHALPAVASFKRSFPDASVDWVIRPRWAPLLEGNPTVDTVIPFDRSLACLRESLRRLRRERYGVAVDFQGLIQSALIARLARAEIFAGQMRDRAGGQIAIDDRHAGIGRRQLGDGRSRQGAADRVAAKNAGVEMQEFHFGRL